jgi:quinol monooxygenase YgiN
LEATPFSRSCLGRRRAIQGLLAMFVSVSFLPDARAEPYAPLSIVRISRASFPPERYETIKARLDEAQKSLVPAIRELTGCLHYFAAIDRDSSTMINVSVWRSLADARQMQTFEPMLALAEEFRREAVQFERPIINYESIWEIH